MGGDLPPEKLLQAVFDLSPMLSSNDTLVVIGSDSIVAECSHLSVETIVASQVVLPDDPPLEAIRKKQDSSLMLGIKLLAEKKVDAFISPGNTGALFAAATIHLKKLPSVHRPGLLTILPTQTTPLGVIDVGGRVTTDAEGLLQCAHMGAEAMNALFGIPQPRVGLLNIGEESIKGTAEHKRAYQLLQESSGKNWVFKGNIEGRNVFSGIVDVLVTDGFTGNVLLKTAEGITQFVLEEVAPILPTDKFQRLKSRLDYHEYPGAILCGVEGLVIKCHGNTGPKGLVKATLEARRLIQNGFLGQF